MEDFQTTAPAIQQTPADAATEAAIDAHLSGNAEKAAPLFNRATIEHRRSAPAEDGATPDPDQWREGAEPLTPMPDAPHVADTEVTAAINKLNSRGDSHAALVQEWGSDFSANLGFAKEQFKQIVATNPDLVAKFESSGLGDHPAVLQFLAKQGRLTAGLMGTMPRNNNPEPMSMQTFIPSTSTVRAAPSGNNRGSEETQTELKRLMNENPPGSDRYKDPNVQNRIQQLHRMIAGSGNVIGRGGRSV